MMARLAERGEQLAERAQQRAARRAAERLSELIGGRAVELDGTRILVSGRELIRRWLTDPALRFLSGGLK